MEEFRNRSIRQFQQALSFKRSERTIKQYTSCIKEVFRFFPEVKPSEITNQQFDNFIFNKITKGISDSYQNQYINAFRAYRIEVLKRKSDYKKFNHLRPKRKKHLPKPISEEQIKKGFSGITNVKHKTYCLLMYATGLRLSELLKLRMRDFNKGEIAVRGKGSKDRLITYGEVVKEQLITFWLSEKIEDYLFPNYSPSSVRKVVRKHFNCTPHQLRHSFATHSLDNGVSLRAIQEMLGHTSPRTTEIYTHVSTKHKREAFKPETILQQL
jgi:integrase/recombinase XerD